MFGKKEKSKQSRPARNLAQFGMLDMSNSIDDISNNFMDDNDDDDDLEAELVALTAGNNDGRKSQRRAPNKPIPTADLDAMVNESIRDINSDEEMSDGEDDSEFLNELKMITSVSSENVILHEEDNSVAESTEQSESQGDGTSADNIIDLLQARLKLYQVAENKARQENESSRARRFNRGVKTLKQLLTDAQAGKAISQNDIPPELPSHATGSATTDSSENYHAESTEQNNPMADTNTAVENNAGETVPATKAVDEETLNLLKSRQQEYKIAAVSWKKAGNMKEALQCVSVVKQFDIVISAVNAGETVDLSDMPPSPNTPGQNTTAPSMEVPKKAENEIQGQASTDRATIEKEAKVTSAGLENLEIALKERLEVCRRIKATAEAEGNSSKARRYGRICKQFESAIKVHARGGSVPLAELPTPPGFEPFAVPTQPSVPPPPTEKSNQLIPEGSPSSQPSENESPATAKTPTPPPRMQTGKKENKKLSRADKQLALLQQRQHELKQGALNAKKDGDLELARNYLRQAKGIDPLIEASNAGLPVDMNSIPLSPSAKKELGTEDIVGSSDDSFTVVNTLDCLEEASGTDEEIYENLEAQLTKQIKWCLCTRDHSKALGDVPGYNRWERLALNYKRDLDMLRVRKRDGLPPPQHHYETKTYAIVQSCTDLSDSDIEISILRGVNYSKDADTYVIYEFPYPSDNPPTDRTITVKGTCNPEYQAVFSLSGIDRVSRPCQRVFKRHALKCQVWAKGGYNVSLFRGFFRSDNLLGTVTVKLQPLETHCVLHDSFPLMDGRKATGAKLEIKIRLRNPILTKEIEQITDKWLTIDY